MQLQKGPLGILGAFALKVLGRNPSQFGDSVTPIVDVYDQYLATSELISNVVGGNLNLAATNTRTFTVPAGKAWRLMGCGIDMGFNGADIALKSIITVEVSSPNSGLPGTVLYSSGTDVGGAVARTGGVAFRPPIFLPSGWSINLKFSCSAAPTVAVPLFSTALYQEIDI